MFVETLASYNISNIQMKLKIIITRNHRCALRVKQSQICGACTCPVCFCLTQQKPCARPSGYRTQLLLIRVRALTEPPENGRWYSCACVCVSWNPLIFTAHLSFSRSRSVSRVTRVTEIWMNFIDPRGDDLHLRVFSFINLHSDEFDQYCSGSTPHTNLFIYYSIDKLSVF